MSVLDPNVVSDPLLRLQHSIAVNSPAIPSTSGDADAPGDLNLNLAVATHLHFSEPTRQAFPLDTPTRFRSSDEPVDLRSIYFAWQKKDVAIPDYIASAVALNEQLSAPGAAGGKVRNLVFVERLDLITWLEGASDESEYITPIESEGTTGAVEGAARIAAGATGIPTTTGTTTRGSGAAVSGSGAGRLAKEIDPRLAEIYRHERRLSDRNRVLQGVKRTDFSHIRKLAETILRHSRSSRPTTTALGPSLPTSHKPGRPARRPDPIILLSQSASSLLRMSNAKSFLESGLYTPPDSLSASSSSNANLLHITRQIPSVDPSRPIRFVLVDTPEQFRPDTWQRVVAVFTTGQLWQFKGYKWQNPPELFRMVKGIYLGWRAEEVPSTVKGWGRGVIQAQVDKYNPQQGPQARWRDREVVEGIWGAVEEAMRSQGWTKDRGPGPR